MVTASELTKPGLTKPEGRILMKFITQDLLEGKANSRLIVSDENIRSWPMLAYYCSLCYFMSVLSSLKTNKPGHCLLKIATFVM